MTESNTITPLTEDQAFSPGADLWIVNGTQDKWWQQIDFKTGFLLSSSLLFKKDNDTSKVQSIIEKTEIPAFHFESQSQHLLLGTANHLFNKWVLIINSDFENALVEIEKISRQLRAGSIRLFGIPRNEILDTTARLSASLPEISFVE